MDCKAKTKINTIESVLLSVIEWIACCRRERERHATTVLRGSNTTSWKYTFLELRHVTWVCVGVRVSDVTPTTVCRQQQENSYDGQWTQQQQQPIWRHHQQEGKGKEMTSLPSCQQEEECSRWITIRPSRCRKTWRSWPRRCLVRGVS